MYKFWPNSYIRWRKSFNCRQDDEMYTSLLFVENSGILKNVKHNVLFRIQSLSFLFSVRVYKRF
jgi:hypothetical protein